MQAPSNLFLIGGEIKRRVVIHHGKTTFRNQLSLPKRLRRNEIFDLRGSDVELLKGGLIVRYKRRGKYHRKEVARVEVRDALHVYLKKSKRLSVLHTNEPLWTRHDRAGEPGPQLTSRSYANNMKKYAAKAGM